MITGQSCRTPCSLQLHSQKFLQGHHFSKLTRSTWFCSDDDDSDSNSDYDSDSDDEDEDDEIVVRSVQNFGRCCWDVYNDNDNDDDYDDNQ